MHLKRTLNSKVLFPLMLLLSSVLLPNAQAQDETQLPIEIEADSLDSQDLTGLSRYLGNVIVTQGTLTLSGDQLDLHHPQRQLEKMVVTGQPAQFRRYMSEQEAWLNGHADTIIYYDQQQKVELIGQAFMQQEGRHKITGPRLFYDLEAQTLTAGSSEQQEGRVSVTLIPDEER